MAIVLCSISKLRYFTIWSAPFRQYKQSSGVTIGALRAFYLSVHPDFFAQHPKIQKVNDSSLKRLNNYLEAIQCRRQVKSVEPTKVTFYFRKVAHTTSKMGFKEVNFTLRSHDLLTNIEHILASCDLSAEHLQDFSKTHHRTDKSSTKHVSQSDEVKAKDKSTGIGVRKWIRENAVAIVEQQSESKSVIEYNDTLKNSICLNFGIREIAWCSPWQHGSEQGILRNFLRICNQHKDQMSCLHGRRLVFTDQTMAAADGSICLNVEDVPQQWLQLLAAFDVAYAASYQAAEKIDELISGRLGCVKVVRPEVCMPRFREHKLFSISEYLSIVDALWTKLQSYAPDENLLKRGMMQKLEIVLVKLQDPQSEMIRVLHDGRLRVDVNCVATHLMNFVSQNAASIETRRNRNASAMVRAEQLTKICKEKLSLPSLTKDLDVDNEQMTTCCEHLLRNSTEFTAINGFEMRITSNYDSTFDNGQFCIPWNWKKKTSRNVST